jgi:hypothetical protein
MLASPSGCASTIDASSTAWRRWGCADGIRFPSRQTTFYLRGVRGFSRGRVVTAAPALPADAQGCAMDSKNRCRLAHAPVEATPGVRSAAPCAPSPRLRHGLQEQPRQEYGAQLRAIRPGAVPRPRLRHGLQEPRLAGARAPSGKFFLARMKDRANVHDGDIPRPATATMSKAPGGCSGSQRRVRAVRAHTLSRPRLLAHAGLILGGLKLLFPAAV